MTKKTTTTRTPSVSFADWIVGIGSSAGGLEALEQFVANIPPEFDGTFIIAQHLAPHSKSMMVELLSRQSALPVVQAADHIEIQPATIYIVPPNHDVDINGTQMVLTVADEAIRPKPSVDEFFESLARARSDRCIGIVLSGTGTDGSRGIQAIKDAGGITIAQDNQSAKYDGMPKSAVETGKVDLVFPPALIAKNLIRTIVERESRSRTQQLDPKGMRPIFDLIREKLGRDFSQYRPSTIGRRIAKRMGLLNLRTYESYLEHLKNTPGEIGELANDMLISVTSFFRDPEVFEEIRKRLIPIFQTHSETDEFRAWVAGCATGEEAYSLAILFLEIQDQYRLSFPIKVFATDLDHDAINEARNGVYAEKDVPTLRGISEKYFVRKSANTLEVCKRVRDCVVFARQDIIQNPPFVKLDMISCRNVMIYFEPELQRRVLEVFHYALSPSGLLLLGKSESILSTPSLFETLDRKNKIFERLNVPSKGLPPTHVQKTAKIELPEVYRKPSKAPSLADIGLKKIMRSYNIAGVIIDPEGVLVQVIGDVSSYLTLAHFQADLRIVNLLPKEVALEVPLLLRRSLKDGKLHRGRTQKIGKGQRARSFTVAVQPLNDEGDDSRPNHKGYFLMTFEPASVKTAPAASSTSDSGEIPSQVSELEHELYLTKENLQTVIEELGVSNEELQSLNEELSSTNEELQASNEELETTNEELQSSNEELTTLNEELTSKTSELRQLSLSLENIQNSIGSPLAVLDSKMRLLRYNSDALKIFFITDSDVGRDFSRISTKCEIPHFDELARDTLETGKVNECICEMNGTIFQLRILPSFDEYQKIIGTILVFIDNTERIRIQDRLAASEERTRAIIEASPSLISLKDNLGRYMLVNTAFKSFFKVQGDIIGKTDREVLNDQLAVQLRDADLEVFVTRTAVKREEVIRSPNGERSVLLTNRFPIMDTQGRTPVAVGTIAIDITAQVDAQEKLQKSESLYRAIAEDQAVFVCRHKPGGTFTYVNEACAQYFGSTLETMKLKTFEELVDPADQALALQTLSSINYREPIAQLDHRVSRWHSEKRWVRWVHKGVFDKNRELIEIQSVGMDVTEWRAQTDRLRDKELIFSSIFDNTSDYIAIYKKTGDTFVLESLNRSAEKTIGTAIGQLVGKRVDELFNTLEASKMTARYQKVLSSNTPDAFEEQVVFGGIEKHYLTTLVPISNDQGDVDRVAALSRDVSNYKAIENDLRVARDSAEVANKAKSEFLASMSHELRTPLNVVLGFSQVLELSELDTEQKDFVAGIRRSGQLLLNLIEDILDISKIEAGKIKLESVSFSISEFVSEVIEIFAAQAKEKDIKLTYSISDSAKRNVLGDPNRLRQVLVNFLGNAIKFTPNGSVHIDIDAQNSKSAGDLQFIFRVKDTGIGLKESEKSKIFKQFSQADTGHARRFGGTGLGLAISKHLIELMDGDVGFESEYGTGSTFWFKVPLTLTNKASEARTLVRVGTTPIRGSKIHVLVVDDSADSRTIAGLFLQRLGHSSELVDSGSAAIEKIKSSTHYDLVLMDMQMPEMDGCETVMKIRKLGYTDIPIVALTANALTEDVDRCIASGMNDYLSKPLRLDDLNHLLNKWSSHEETATH